MRNVSEKIVRVGALVLTVILFLGTLPACTSPTALSVSLTLSEPPVLNKPVEITLAFSLKGSYRLDGGGKDVPASIRLPQHIVLVSGDLEWRGDVVHNRVYTVRAVVKAVQVGYYQILGGAGGHVPVIGSDDLYVGVFENYAIIYGLNNRPRVPFETPEPPGPVQGSDAPATIFSSKLSYSEPPVLGKPVLVTLDFALKKDYPGAGRDATASILLPVDGFEVVSTDLKARQEMLAGFAPQDKPGAMYTSLEWHGDVIRGESYSIQASVKAIRTGYWTTRGGAYLIAGGGGADFVYLGVFEDRAEISDLPLPRRPDGVPVYDAEHPDAPPTFIPFDQMPKHPTPKAMPYDDSAHGGSALDFANPLTIKGKLECYISQNSTGSKHLDIVDPVPLIWGQINIYDAYGLPLGQGLTNRGTGGPYGTNDGEYSITVENPYPYAFYVVSTPDSDMAAVRGDEQVPYYDVRYDHAAVPFSQADVDMGTANPADVSPDDRSAWRIYETLANDVYDRGAYYFLRYSPRGPQTTEVGGVVARYPVDPWPPGLPDPPLYDPWFSHALYFDQDNQTRALDIVQHEYGHFVQHGVMYDWNPFSPIQPAIHYLNQVSSPTLGWTEGWADFFPLVVQDDKYWDDARVSPPPPPVDMEEKTWGWTSPPHPEAWDDGDQVEGRVAGALWDIYDSASDGIDQFNGGFGLIWDTFSTYVDDTFSEFWQDWQTYHGAYPESIKAATKSIFQNTIHYGPTVKAALQGESRPNPEGYKGSAGPYAHDAQYTLRIYDPSVPLDYTNILNANLALDSFHYLFSPPNHDNSMELVNIDGTNHTVEFAVAWAPNNYQVALGIYEDSSPLTSGHTLINLKTVDLRNVFQVNMCTLLEGNCNASNQVTILDFSILSASYLKSYSDPGFDWRADFDYSGQVNSSDFSLLSANFMKTSPQTCSGMLGPQLGSTTPVALRLTTPPMAVPAGKSFSVAIVVDAGTQPVSGIDACLNFDPNILEVVAIKGGSALPTTIVSRFDNTLGTIDFAAGTLSQPAPTGTFNLVTIEFKAKGTGATTAISFSQDSGRKTDAAFEGTSVLGAISGTKVTVGF